MQWFISQTGQNKQGPFTQEQFNTMVQSGQISANTMVWHTGMSEWTRYGQLGPNNQPVSNFNSTYQSANTRSAPSYQTQMNDPKLHQVFSKLQNVYQLGLPGTANSQTGRLIRNWSRTFKPATIGLIIFAISCLTAIFFHYKLSSELGNMLQGSVETAKMTIELDKTRKSMLVETDDIINFDMALMDINGSGIIQYKFKPGITKEKFYAATKPLEKNLKRKSKNSKLFQSQTLHQWFALHLRCSFSCSFWLACYIETCPNFTHQQSATRL